MNHEKPEEQIPKALIQEQAEYYKVIGLTGRLKDLRKQFPGCFRDNPESRDYSNPQKNVYP